MDFELLAEEQEALRRVATLVARGAAPATVFEAVAAEVARLLEFDFALVGRYEADATLTHVASHPLELVSQLGSRTVLDGDDLASVSTAQRPTGLHRLRRLSRVRSRPSPAGSVCGAPSVRRSWSMTGCGA